MSRTRICDVLGTENPTFLAGTRGVSYTLACAAVSGGGGAFRDIRSGAEIASELVAEAEATTGRLASLRG